jgi:hypothetical protein
MSKDSVTDVERSVTDGKTEIQSQSVLGGTPKTENVTDVYHTVTETA